MGPLSAKQHREYLKHEANEKRKDTAFAKEQERKEQLHQLKLKEAGAKASQGIAHKEENHAMKLAEGTNKVPRINRQKLGLPSMNPLAGSEVLGQGQKSLPGMVPKGTDTVPAMLTPGEAVIPAPAAQNPKNKKAIKKMVNEGRKANRTGVLGFADGTIEVPQLEVQPLTIQDPRLGYTAPMSNGKYIENIPTRSNNPGNLMYAGQPNSIPGVPRPGGGNFALFANPEAGAAALERQVAKNTQDRGQNIKQMMAKYAPKNENNTSKYVKNLSKDLGISPTAKVPMEKVPALSRAISKYEGYKGEYYADGTIEVPSLLDRALNFIAGQTPSVPATTQVPVSPSRYAVSDDILASQRGVESNNQNVYPVGHPKAGQLITSPKGALGIAQIMPATAANPGFNVQPISIEDLKDENKAKQFQGSYMAAMSERYKGDTDKALTAYNAGAGNVDKAIERATKAGKPDAWKDYLPTQEAKEYSNKVMAGLNPNAAVPPLASPGTGFASNDGGAAFGNPNVTRQGTKSVPRQQAIGAGTYQAVPNITESTPAMQSVSIPDTRFEVPAVKAVPTTMVTSNEPTVSQEVPKDTAALDAMVAGFSQQVAPQIQEATKQAEAIADPAEKQSFLEKFITNIYGSNKSLFNDQDLSRFAVIAAGSLLTGTPTGRSLRFAAKDTLANADKRNAVQVQQDFEREKIKAVDDRTERNKLIDQGYEPANIDKYLKSRTINDLGTPKTTYNFKETGKQFTIDRGPQSGTVFQVVEATTKTGKGSGDTTLMVVDPRTNNKVPLNTFQANAQKLGYNVVDYSSATHSPLARANRVKEWVEKDANTIADQAIEQVYGSSNVKGKPNTARANVPTSSAMGAQAASFFKSIGFEPSDANEMLEGKNIMNVAVKDMINDQQSRKSKIEDLTPYLSRSMITIRSGVSPDLFKIGIGEKARVMPPEKIVQLDYLVKQAAADLGGGETNQAAQQALYQKMATAWTNNPKLREQYAKPGSEESSFYMFMKDTLSKGLKQ